jgi:hypothetical protein
VGSLLVYLIAWFAYVLSLADEPLKLGPVLFLVFGFGPGIVLLAGVPFAIMAFASSRLTRRFTIQKR